MAIKLVPTENENEIRVRNPFDYDNLANTPTLNGVVIEGDKTSADYNLQDKLTIDNALSATSENPVQNKVITEALNTKANSADVESRITPLETDTANLATALESVGSQVYNIDQKIPTQATAENKLITNSELAAVRSIADENAANITILQSGKADLDADGKVPQSQLPPLPAVSTSVIDLGLVLTPQTLSTNTNYTAKTSGGVAFTLAEPTDTTIENKITLTLDVIATTSINWGINVNNVLSWFTAGKYQIRFFYNNNTENWTAEVLKETDPKSSTVLYIPFNGSVVDESANPLTLTASGSNFPAYTEGVYPNTQAIISQGSNQYITLSGDTSKLNLGTSDFTISAWVLAKTSYGVGNRFWGMNNSNSFVLSDGGVHFYYEGTDVLGKSLSGFTDGQRVFFTLCRQGAALYLFLDGVLQKQQSINENKSFDFSGWNRFFWSNIPENTLQEFVVKSTCDYTSDFSVPTAPFGNSESGIADLHDPSYATMSEVSELANDISDLSSEVNDIRSVIPTEATSTNKLADKQYVDDSVSQLIPEKDYFDPADYGYPDIRSTARPKSIVLLAAHKANYSAYNNLGFVVAADNGGYKVFIDGTQFGDVFASNTKCSIVWNEWTATNGFAVSQPEALTAHIIQIVPEVATANITSFNANKSNNNNLVAGILWAHFNTNTAITLSTAFSYDGIYDDTHILTAITGANGVIKVSSIYEFCNNAVSVKYVDTLDFNNVSILGNRVFRGCQNIKKVKLKNGTLNTCYQMFQNCSSLTEIETENITFNLNNNDTFFAFLYTVRNLKNIPYGIDFTASKNLSSFLVYATSINNTFLDLSYAESLKILGIVGDSSRRINGLKGLVVSNNAPFDGDSPQINVSYTGLDKNALVALFKSLPTVSNSQIINITGATGANSLNTAELNIATNKGWTITR